MPQKVTLYRLLIASPSDVVEERKIIQEAIYSWNSVNSLTMDVVLEPVLWETHSTPEMGDRPQAIINKQLVDNCDVLIGVFWTRIGTPTGVSESGTVEEIDKFKKVKKPIMLYFSSKPVVPTSIDTTQYGKLIEFKRKCEREGLVFGFDSSLDLREKAHRHIAATISKLHGLPQKESNNAKSSRPLQMFKWKFEYFLREFEADWKSERDSNPTTLDEGKIILKKAFSSVVEFRSKIVDTKGSKLTEILDDAAKKLKALQRHQIYVDGGKSFDEFWKRGDAIIALLKEAVDEIDSELK